MHLPFLDLMQLASHAISVKFRGLVGLFVIEIMAFLQPQSFMMKKVCLTAAHTWAVRAASLSACRALIAGIAPSPSSGELPI